MSPVFLLEAMAARKTVVAGKIGGIPEYITNGEDGLLARYNDPGDFARQIIRALKNQQLANDLGYQAGEKVKTLCNPAESLNKLTSCYEQALHAYRLRGTK